MKWQRIEYVNQFGRSKGFSLIELMIAMILGLVAIAVVGSMFIGNMQSYKSNKGISEVQSRARMAFELLARDIREAGETGCGNKLNRIGNILNNGPHMVAAEDVPWWQDWQNPIQGYDASEADNIAPRAANTDSVTLLSASSANESVVTISGGGDGFVVENKPASFKEGELVVVCDFDHALIGQWSSTEPLGSNFKLKLGVDSALTPGNCTDGLGRPVICDQGIGNEYQYGTGALITQAAASHWYVGESDDGKSLYKMTLKPHDMSSNKTDPIEVEPVEMVRGVVGMKITYHENEGVNKDSFVSASQVNDWAAVDALRVSLTVKNNTSSDESEEVITREFSSTTAIRSRLK